MKNPGVNTEFPPASFSLNTIECVAETTFTSEEAVTAYFSLTFLLFAFFAGIK